MRVLLCVLSVLGALVATNASALATSELGLALLAEGFGAFGEVFRGDAELLDRHFMLKGGCQRWLRRAV